MGHTFWVLSLGSSRSKVKSVSLLALCQILSFLVSVIRFLMCCKSLVTERGLRMMKFYCCYLNFLQTYTHPWFRTWIVHHKKVLISYMCCKRMYMMFCDLSFSSGLNSAPSSSRHPLEQVGYVLEGNQSFLSYIILRRVHQPNQMCMYHFWWQTPVSLIMDSCTSKTPCSHLCNMNPK